MNKYKPDLQALNRYWRRTLYSKIENIFSYENLPEEINERALKFGLFSFGKLVFYKIGEKYLVQNFTYTDKLDWYYVPKNGRVVNPWLPQGHQNWEFEVDKEAVIWSSTPDMYTFKQHSLVSDLIFKTAAQLSENDISYYCIQRNHRLIAIITAQNDKQKMEADRMLEKMYNGDSEMVMLEDLVSRIQVNPIAMNATRSPLTELIEFQQYVLANFYHSFGINSNYNLKREQLNSNEIDVNKEVLRLNIEDMLKNREMGVEKINDLYGLDIRVSLNEEVYASLIQDVGMLEQGQAQAGNTPEFQNQSSSVETGEGEDENKNISEFPNEQHSENGNNNNVVRNVSEQLPETTTEEETSEQSTENPSEDMGEESGDVFVNITINTENSNLRVDTEDSTEDSTEEPTEPKKE